MIGPHRFDACWDTSGRRRLEATDDLVRREIAEPGDWPARDPGAGRRKFDAVDRALAPDLAHLARRNAAAIGDRQFLRDPVDHLIEQIEHVLGHYAGNARSS